MADGSIIIDTKVDSSGAEKGIKSLGGMASKSLGAVTKATALMATGIAAATGAVAMLNKASVEQYAQYEQLVGGVETLFKDSSSQVMQYADNAYKTAGMSANEYMNTITGFSASLLQGLGGDTKKAAEIGNQAVIDMADNANKMGTPIENIQNAYQGFAKQNYTMLDNLKLGYGGTKSEMERLLADAQKLTGVHYDISNFSDVIQAIHAVQDNIGITGTTAKEAMSTIEGSLNMTKAAWSNMLTGMADDNSDFDTLVDNLVESVGALGENLLPRIETALNGVGKLIDKLLPVILAEIPDLISSILPGMVEAGTNIVASLGNAILESLPTVIDYGIQLIQSLLTGIQQNLPSIMTTLVSSLTALILGIDQLLPQLLATLMQGVTSLLNSLAEQAPTLIQANIQSILDSIIAFIDNAPMLLEAGLNLLEGIAQGIVNALPTLIESLPKIIQGILDFFSSGSNDILEAGLNIILTLIDGIVKAIPKIIEVLPQIIQSFIDFFTNNMPQIIDTGIQVLLALIDGLVKALPQLIEMLPQIINAINDGLLAHLPELIDAGVKIIVALAKGLAKAIPQLVGAIPQIVKAIWNAFTSVNWGEIGSNILKGIGTGIKGAITGMVQVGIEACKTLKDSVKEFFGIHSPSHVMRDEVGKMLTAGIGVGITQGLTSLLATAKDACNKINSIFTKELNADTAQAYINTISNIKGSFVDLANEITKANEELEKANNADVMDNTDYSSLYYKIEDLSGRIEDAKEAKNEKLQKTLEAEKKVLDKELALNKEVIEQEIKARKEAAQQAVNIAKEKEEKLKNLASATVEAIKNKLTEEKTTRLNNISAEMDAEEERYNKKVANIDKAGDKEKARLQEKLDALEDEAQAEDRLKELQEARNNIAVLQAKMSNTASVADKKAYALKIKNAQAELANKENEWEREDKKAKIQEQITQEEERASAKKEALKEEYEATKESYEKQKDEVEDYYSKLLETDSLNAQARYMLLQGNNDELVELLQSYNPQWQDAGQSLADSLLYGLNSQKESIKDAVNEIMSLTGRSSYDSKESHMATAGGYATGTSYNSRSGLYNVDEKGFELSTGGGVAYVSKGAGILNHMQSLNAIKEEVKEQVGTFADKLRSAVMMDQYRMSQLAFAGVNNSYGGNSYDNSSINLNVDKFINSKNDSIENIANELGFYAKKKKRS